MSAYNVRLFNYVGGQQLRIYSDVYNAKEEDLTESIQPKERAYEWVNPAERVDSAEIWNNIEYYERFLKEMEDKQELEERAEKYLAKSKSRTIQKIYEITRSNKWEWFVTLTFNPEIVDSYDYGEVTKKLSVWLSNLKLTCSPDLRYLVVPEFHKSGRYHFHGLFADVGTMKLVDSGKVTDSGEPIYNIGNYKMGFTTATRIRDNSRVCSYITKYVTKDLCATTQNKKRYWASRNLDKVRINEYLMSQEEIKQMLEDLGENITYCKTTGSVLAESRVKYIEIADREK